MVLGRLMRRFGREPEPWRPSVYRVTRTAAGADVNYACYCGCDAGFAFDRSVAEPAPEHCCCGNAILVGRDAGRRLVALGPASAEYRVELGEVMLPWGQQAEVALAIPLATAAHR